MCSTNSTPKPRVFLDSSALFSGVFSSSGAARLILRLGESGVVELLVSSQVVAETERALRRKAARVLGHLAIVLDASGCRVVPNPGLQVVREWESLIPYLPDASLLAAAVAAGADYFVTLDRQHFLESTLLMSDPPLRIGTPGDLVDWLRSRLGAAAKD